MDFKADVQAGRGQFLNETVCFTTEYVKLTYIWWKMAHTAYVALSWPLHGPGKYYSLYIDKTFMWNH